MNNASPTPEEIRGALLSSLPGNDDASWQVTREPQFTYVPPSHARALDPESVLVEGIRGAGKSFWWAALNSKEHRDFVRAAYPETHLPENMTVSQGFGASVPPEKAPSKDVLQKLACQSDANCRHIWRAVVATHTGFNAPFPQTGKWEEKVNWVVAHPEEYDTLLHDADSRAAAQGKIHLIMFDALDRLADNWEKIRPLAKALFQVALDLRSFRAIRMKLFVRPDMLKDEEILAFPDASKLLARRVSLNWRRADLYALLFQCLGNATTGGKSFRERSMLSSNRLFKPKWGKNAGAWVLPAKLRTDEEHQRTVFHTISGPTMGAGPSGHKRGLPYTWLANHLVDGRDQVSPRSFTAALRHAVSEELPAGWPYALHFKAIQTGVQEASRVRVREITEDYPWVEQLMNPLRGNITVPCSARDILRIWKKDKIIENSILNDQKLGTLVVLKTPPHLYEGPEAVLNDLVDLGLVQRLTDGRIQMPDVYRIAFGLGRRGGVKPLR